MLSLPSLSIPLCWCSAATATGVIIVHGVTDNYDTYVDVVFVVVVVAVTVIVYHVVDGDVGVVDDDNVMLMCECGMQN